MESSSALLAQSNYLLCPSRHSSSSSLLLSPPSKTHFSSPLKFQLQNKQLSFASYQASSPVNRNATLSDIYSETVELADIDWDNLGFGFLPTDYMYIMKCAQGENFSRGE